MPSWRSSPLSVGLGRRAVLLGVLCLFLLDMGLVASRGIRQGARDLSVPLGIFAIVMPLVGVVLGAVKAVDRQPGSSEAVARSAWLRPGLRAQASG